MTMSSPKEIGYFGENYVCGFLIRHGYEIVKKNFTIRGGEIDIIAMKKDIIAFVEVKTRKPGALVSGEEAIDFVKKQHIIKTAESYIERFVKGDFPYRFDVAVLTEENSKVINLKYYAGAFDAGK